MDGIQIKSLKKIYGKDNNKIVALGGVTFNINKGEFAVVLGPSGSGKSTLLNILGGMDKASGGSVRVGEKEIGKLDEKGLTAYRRDDVGFVFQFYNLMSNLTALENVQLAENKGGLKAKDVLKMVGLEKRLNNFPAQLSGGEQQRVAIARAIVKSPQLLLCDEPTGALDSATGKAIVTLLLKLCKEQNQTIVIVTHNAQLAEVADRVIKLSDGKVIANIIKRNKKTVEELDW